MINHFSFGLPETSSGGGNNSIRFFLSGNSIQYLELSSSRLFGHIKDTDTSDRAKFLRPFGGLHAFLERYRAMVGGQIVPDVIEYNRWCETADSF